MLDYNRLNNKDFFENAIADGKITPQMIIQYIMSDTFWFMKNISKCEHQVFIEKIKKENIIYLGTNLNVNVKQK